MTAISEREAKTQYYWIGAEIIGYSLKVASTYITSCAKAPYGGRYKRVGQYEVMLARRQGTPVHLVVRHPLDRLVSNWKFWTKVAPSEDLHIKAASPEDHSILMGEVDSSLEEWTRAAHRQYNAHWFPQSEYHAREGTLVPNILWPLESLGKPTDERLLNKSPRKASWEDYYTDSFRSEMEDYYANDVELYEKSKEMWDGRSAPTILCGSK